MSRWPLIAPGSATLSLRDHALRALGPGHLAACHHAELVMAGSAQAAESLSTLP